uniref:Protein BCCIP homolog n=1 Tax=Kalanchoe fedtschenkoi TaxID=63787 RepID=A0A7N0T6Y7_KALFE
MPRKPVRHNLGPQPRPRMFSSYGRSVARLSSAYVPKSEYEEDAKTSPEEKIMRKVILKDDDELSESSDDEEESDGVVQADFVFFDPKTDDFHGVKMLLQTYLDDKEWDLSGFVDLILAQPTVGTVVKVEDAEDEGIFAIVSSLNLERYKHHQSVEEVKHYLLDICPKPDIREKLKGLFNQLAHGVGLLVSQRVVNLPPQLLPPLYDGLFDEISWATEDEPTEELRNSFCFKTYLIVTRIYKANKSSSSDDEGIVFAKHEEEIFHRLSSWSFTFALRTGPPVPPELRNYRLMGMVMAVDANKVSSFRQQLKSLIE